MVGRRPVHGAVPRIPRAAATAWRWICGIVGTAALLAALAAVTIVVVLPLATGGVARTVVTGSMAPEIPVGAVVLDRPVNAASLHVGDVATYEVRGPDGSGFVTHRIVAIDRTVTPALFTFKGDANNTADPRPVPADWISGAVWFSVPHLGAVRDFLATATGYLILLAACTALLLGYGARRLLVIRGGRAAPGPFGEAETAAMSVARRGAQS